MNIIESIATTLRAKLISVREVAKTVETACDKLSVSKDKRTHKLSGEKKVKLTFAQSIRKSDVVWQAGKDASSVEAFISAEERTALLFADWHDRIIEAYDRHGMPEVMPAECFPVGMLAKLAKQFPAPAPKPEAEKKPEGAKA